MTTPGVTTAGDHADQALQRLKDALRELPKNKEIILNASATLATEARQVGVTSQTWNEAFTNAGRDHPIDEDSQR